MHCSRLHADHFVISTPDSRITHGWGAGAHLPEDFFARNAAIHDPHAVGFAMLVFDFGEEVFERGFICCVAWQYFIGQRIALGRDDEGDDDLLAIAAVASLRSPFGQPVAGCLPSVGCHGCRQSAAGLLIARADCFQSKCLLDRNEALHTSHQRGHACVG